jgi:hypothetical protein
MVLVYTRYAWIGRLSMDWTNIGLVMKVLYGNHTFSHSNHNRVRSDSVAIRVSVVLATSVPPGHYPLKEA